jgi:hypothetical protein
MDPSVAIVFQNDLDAAFGCIDKAMPKDVPSIDMVEVDEDGKSVAKWLAALLARYSQYEPYDLEAPPVGIDFETTGKKPYRTGHRVVMCAIADRVDHAMAFVMSKQVEEALIPVLRSPRIPKVAHNIKMEQQWASVVMNAPIANWLWCSMTAAHLEDNRGGEEEAWVISLEFQAAARLGVFGFKSETDEYLSDTGDEKHGANTFNRIHDCPPLLLLRRNGMDALVTLRLSLLQMQEAEKRAAKGKDARDPAQP